LGEPALSDESADRLSLDEFVALVLNTGMLWVKESSIEIQDALELELDSLNLVELLAIIEEQGVAIDGFDESDLAAIRTLRDAHLFYLTQGQIPSRDDHSDSERSEVANLPQTLQ
jgi:acyl carrier protein